MPDMIQNDRLIQLTAQGEKMFSDRGNMLSLWQTIAENFYPQRATFSVNKWNGADMAGNLTTSAPLLANRDMCDVFMTMLQPSGQDWFKASTNHEDGLSIEDRRWLARASNMMKNGMYDRKSGYQRAVRQLIDDIGPFGQGVMSAEFNRDTQSLLYRNWHLRDMAWIEKADGTIGRRERKWKAKLWYLNKTFKGRISDSLKGKLSTDPYMDVNVRHVVVPADEYDAPSGKKWRKPWVSIYYEEESKNILEEVAIPTGYYIIPRWQTVSDTQYAYSPSVIAALPDARLIQDMFLTLLEAGQKAVDPPLIATANAIKNIDAYAGGISYADAEYDERMGEVLRPITQDFRGITYGFQLLQIVNTAIERAFYLNKINLPQVQGKMTAFEVGQRIQEYVRNALPLFEPLESEVNGQICDDSWALCMDASAFGPVQDIPRTLMGREISFKFRNPLKDYADQAKKQNLLEGLSLVASVAQIDPIATKAIKTRIALPDALVGSGMDPDWIASEEELAQEQEAQEQQAAVQQGLGTLQQGAETAKTFGEASQALAPEQAQ